MNMAMVVHMVELRQLEVSGLPHHLTMMQVRVGLWVREDMGRVEGEEGVLGILVVVGEVEEEEVEVQALCFRQDQFHQTFKEVILEMVTW